MERFTYQQNPDRFVHRENVKRFQKLIVESIGETPHKQLFKLLADEVAKDHLLSKEK